MLSITVLFAVILAAAFHSTQSAALPPGCSYEGVMPHPTNCEKFFMCSIGHPAPEEMDCPLGPNNEKLYFNPELGVCDYRSKVRCGNGIIVVPPRTRPTPPRTRPTPPRTRPTPPRTRPTRPRPRPTPRPTRPRPQPTPRPTRPTTTQSLPQFTEPTCFQARSDGYGIINVPRSGFLRMVVLMHISGNVSCYADKPQTYSKWGCSDLFPGKLNIYITRSKTEWLYPDTTTVERDSYNFYSLESALGEKFDENSDAIIFEDQTPRVEVKAGEKLQLWYGEDLMENLLEEEINAGESCAIVDLVYF